MLDRIRELNRFTPPPTTTSLLGIPRKPRRSARLAEQCPLPGADILPARPSIAQCLRGQGLDDKPGPPLHKPCKLTSNSTSLQLIPGGSYPLTQQVALSPEAHSAIITIQRLELKLEKRARTREVVAHNSSYFVCVPVPILRCDRQNTNAHRKSYSSLSYPPSRRYAAPVGNRPLAMRRLAGRLPTGKGPWIRLLRIGPTSQRWSCPWRNLKHVHKLGGSVQTRGLRLATSFLQTVLRSWVAMRVIAEVSTDTRLSWRPGLPGWQRFIRVLVPCGWPRFAARSARPLAGGLSHLDLVRRGRWGPISFPRPVGAGNGMPGGWGRRSRRARRGRSPQEGGAVLKR